jgi:predicted membrane-bound dolichyl-phosphate-mannose-protein mannosyltransferase
MLKHKNIFILILVLLAVSSRLIPHPLNFTPIGALGLFAGAYIVDKRVWALPIIALLLSDFFVGFYEPIAMLFVYLGFALSAFIGRFLLSEKRTSLRLGGAALSSATVFFIVSNFGTWLSGTLYPMTLNGLTECFVMAIPFYGNTLLGDLFYVVVLFGIYEASQSWMQKRNIAQAA